MLTNIEYNKHQNKIAIDAHWIVHLTDGISDWYISDIDIKLTDGHCYPLLEADIKIQEKVDIFRKRWSVNDLVLKLSNIKYKRNSSGSWVSLSDEIKAIAGDDIKVYLAVGRNITSISDCLLRYHGVVNDPPVYNESIVTIKAQDKGKMVHRILPLGYVSDSFSPPVGFKDEKIPLVYGDFTMESDFMDGSGLGMARCAPTEQGRRTNFVVSDHALDALTELWFLEPGIEDVTEFETPTLNINDSGRGTAIGGRLLIARLNPNNNDDDSYSTSGLTMPSDYYDAFDGSSSSFVPLDTNISPGDGSTVYPEGQLMLGFDSDDFISKVSPYTDSGFKLKINAQDGTPTIISQQMRLYYRSDGTNDVYHNESWAVGPSAGWDETGSWQDIPDAGGDSYSVTGATNATPIVITVSSHNMSTGDKVVISSVGGNVGANGEWIITRNSGTQFTLNGSAGTGAYTSGGTVTDTTKKNQIYMIGLWARALMSAGPFEGTLAKVYSTQLLIRYPMLNKRSYAFAVCRGREYGSWITGRVDSASVGTSYAVNNMISDPSGIIESICRDELGMVDADFDLPSFIDAENTSVEQRINIHSGNEESSDKIIRRLCEQSTMAFFHSGVAGAKAIPLNNESPTVDRTIPYSHLVPNQIQVGESNFVVTDITYEYDWHEEDESFHSNLNFTHSSLTDAFGFRPFKVRWKNIAGTSLSHVALHLVNTTNALWSNPHPQITIETIGLTNADLQVGDWISLDSTSVDPHITYYGASWSGKKFLVVDVSVGIDKTKIIAIDYNN